MSDGYQGLAESLNVQGFIDGGLDSASYQPLPELWARIPAEAMDVVAPEDRIGGGWSPNSVLIECALGAMPGDEVVTLGVEQELRDAFSGNGSVRPLTDIPGRGKTVGLSGGFLYEGMDLWSDTQYVLDSSRLVLRQQTFTCELSRRNEYIDAMSKIRDWFMTTMQ